MPHTKPVNVYLNAQAVRELIKLDEEPWFAAMFGTPPFVG